MTSSQTDVRLALPVIIRPNGKPYRPRKIVVQAWENDDTGSEWEGGAVVLGTHDVERARPLAADLIRRVFDSRLQPVRPGLRWTRLGFDGARSEMVWIEDEERGRAAVWFEAEEVDA